MGIITDVQFQKKNKKRVSIFVDGQFVTGMESIVAMSKGLKAGDAIDEGELLALAFESQKSEAFDKALKYVSTAFKTEKEIRTSLAKKEYPKVVIDYCVDKLKEYGYLNDQAYANAYLNTYSDSRGVNKIKQDLLTKGVDKQIVESTLEKLDDQVEVAVKTAQKYIKTHKNVNKQKVMQHLYSKGFTYSDIYSAVDELDFSEEEQDA